MNRFKHVCAASQNRKGQEIHLVLTGNFCVDPLSHLPCGSVNGTFFVNNSSLHTGEGISFYFSSDLATKEVSIRISLIDVDDTHCGNGTYIMQQVLIFLSLLKRDCPEMKYTMITGTLTDKDRKLGNWEKSIPFYRKLVHRCPDEFQYNMQLVIDDASPTTGDRPFRYLLTPKA